MQLSVFVSADYFFSPGTDIIKRTRNSHTPPKLGILFDEKGKGGYSMYTLVFYDLI